MPSIRAALNHGFSKLIPVPHAVLKLNDNIYTLVTFIYFFTLINKTESINFQVNIYFIIKYLTDFFQHLLLAFEDSLHDAKLP